MLITIPGSVIGTEQRGEHISLGSNRDDCPGAEYDADLGLIERE